MSPLSHISYLINLSQSPVYLITYISPPYINIITYTKGMKEVEKALNSKGEGSSTMKMGGYEDGDMPTGDEGAYSWSQTAVRCVCVDEMCVCVEMCVEI